MDGEARQRPDVRTVYVEFPILGNGSVEASRAAVASIAQGRYLPFHTALLQHKGALSPDAIETIAADVGLDTRRLRRDMNALEVDVLLRNNHQLAALLGIRSTPSFVVNDALVAGYDLEALAQVMARAEAGGS